MKNNYKKAWKLEKSYIKIEMDSLDFAVKYGDKKKGLQAYEEIKKQFQKNYERLDGILKIVSSYEKKVLEGILKNARVYEESGLEEMLKDVRERIDVGLKDAPVCEEETDKDMKKESARSKAVTEKAKGLQRDIDVYQSAWRYNKAILEGRKSALDGDVKLKDKKSALKSYEQIKKQFQKIYKALEDTLKEVQDCKQKTIEKCEKLLQERGWSDKA